MSEKSNSDKNFVDIGGHGKDKCTNQEIKQSIRPCIERLGYHLPICITRALEDSPLENSHDAAIKLENSSYSNNWESSKLHWDNSVFSRRSSTNSEQSYTGAHVSVSSNISDISPVSPIDLFSMPLPKENKYHWTALLLIDISGFTKLSVLLDIESLSKTINTYFELLIAEVTKFGGDVLKFAGDAFYCEWRDDYADGIEDLEDVVTTAAVCGRNIVEKFSQYKVLGLSSEEALLDVHCGLGVGQLATVHVGNFDVRREFLFLGSPIDQVSAAESIAECGQLVASSEALSILKKTSNISDEILSSTGPQIIAYREAKYFDVKDKFINYEDNEKRCYYKLTYVSTHIMKSLKNVFSLYVHQAARRTYRQGFNALADAEIRSVYTMFIKPQIVPKITGNIATDGVLFSMLNNIMGVILHVLNQYKGHLRQFIVDDKGVVVIVTFGQRGATFPNMVTEKGLPASIAIHRLLKVDLDLDSSVGATFGKAYCGVVGASHRHEFAILGPSVNLAARLMCSNYNPGILVDESVRKMASKRYDFFSLPPVKAKGYEGLVPIFEPKHVIERQWSKISSFVGREVEVKLIVDIAKHMLRRKEKSKSKLVLVQAHSGLGKSSLAMHIIEKISCIRVSSRRNIIIKKNVCTEYEEHFPFGVFRQIIRDILIEREHDAGYGSDSSLSTDGLDDGLTHNTSDTLHLESLQDLCAELNYSEELVNSVAENMLGLKPSGSSFKDEEKKLEPVDAVDLVSDIFLKCMSGNNFVFLALDDTQWMDSLSWKVVERIMDLGVNFMIICLSRPLTRNRDEGFLTTLQEEVKNSHHPRFFCLSLLPFSKNDVKNLLGAAFECDPSKIEENICDHLYETTGGMPYFTQEIISNLIKKDLIELKKSGSIGWRSELSKEVNIYSNVNDLLLHRLDDFKSEGRSLLQLCAVLGFEFSLSELLSVQCRGRRRKPKQVKEIQGILNRAVNERILLEISQGGSSYKRKGDNLSSQILRSEENEVCEKFYTFTHSIWLNCVLGTMLEDWKRDLHKTVASVLEIQGYGDLKDLKSANRLFGHWKYANNLMKAGELALKLGTYFHSLLLIREASDVCLEAIQMWKDVYPIKKEGVDIAGMSKTLIDSIAPDEIDLLARLHVAVARMGDGKETRIFYRKAYIILTQSPSAANMKDRRVFFAVISGLFVCVKNGLCEDRGLSVESLAKTFVEQAEIHGDPVHIARALSMESLAFASLGKFEDAIASQKKLEKIYSADELSKGIILEYASDRAAQNYGYSVTWYELLGHYEECDRQIKYILEEIMPMMPIQNVHNSLIILCPILWVLMDKQKSQEAETIFVTYVYDRFYEVYGKNSTTYYFSMYKPLRTLFLLAGEDEDRQKEEKYTSKQNYQSIENWVFSDRFDSIKEYISITMRPYGKDPHSILAEICYYLAVVQGQDKTRQKKLLHKGFELAQRSISKTKDDPGIECAYHRGKKILKKIQNVVGNLPHDNERDIGSIHARLELEYELISLEDISVFVNRVVKTSKDKFQSHDKTYSAGMFMATNIQSWEMLGQNERGLMYAIVDRHVMIDQVVALLEHRLSLALDAQVRKPRLSCEAKAELRAYVTCIESLYNQVEYHSFQHIVHAIISMNKLIEMVVNSQLIRESIIEEEVYYTHFLMIFSVLIHDVAHTGMSNKILLDQNHAFVGKYGCVSTAETLSIDLSINILFHNEFSKIKCAILPTIHHKIKFGKVIFSSILCTDIASSDRMKMCKMRFDTLKDTLDNSQHDMQPKKEVCGPQLCKLVSFKENFHKFSFLSDEELETYHSELVCTQETLKSMVLTESLMQTADIAHTMQDWKNFLKWNYRLYKELMNCHRQGFMHNPSQHWSQGEIGFFEGYVIPLATRTEFCFRNAPLKLVKLANNNLRRWRIQGDAVTKLFILGVENQEAEEDVLRKCFSLSHSVGDLN